GTVIASTGSSVAAGQVLTLATLVPIIAPMGAAVVPHALGVWIGHSFESRRVDALTTIEQSILKKLADDADETRDVLKDLYSKREQLLRDEVTSLQRQGALWKSANADLSSLLQQARIDIGQTLTDAQAQLRQVGTAAVAVANEMKEP